MRNRGQWISTPAYMYLGKHILHGFQGFLKGNEPPLSTAIMYGNHVLSNMFY